MEKRLQKGLRSCKSPHLPSRDADVSKPRSAASRAWRWCRGELRSPLGEPRGPDLACPRNKAGEDLGPPSGSREHRAELAQSLAPGCLPLHPKATPATSSRELSGRQTWAQHPTLAESEMQGTDPALCLSKLSGWLIHDEV